MKSLHVVTLALQRLDPTRSITHTVLRHREIIQLPNSRKQNLTKNFSLCFSFSSLKELYKIIKKNL